MSCLYCGRKTNRPKFCCNKHKDKYHNEHNPRGFYAHLKRNTEIEDTEFAFNDSYSLGQD